MARSEAGTRAGHKPLQRVTMPDRIQLVTTALYETLIERARQAPRKRVNHNFHASLEENPHRFLNVMLRGTYIAPHRHLDPPKSESFLALEGRVACFIFSDSGEIREMHVLGGETVGIDISPGVWHTIATLTPHAVCYEVKPGPYLASNDKDFASWAPREGDPGAAAYLEKLISTVDPHLAG